MVNYKLNTGEGRVKINVPLKYKGKKILPQVYKVIGNKKKYALVGLYQRDGKRLSLIKYRKICIK
jgi:hypothetical protein